MYTEEALLKGTFKRSIIEEEQWFIANELERPDTRRESSTIVGGVLSRDRVNQLISGEEVGDWMINDCGVVGINDGTVVFLTDDSSISLNLPRNFRAIQWRLPNSTGFGKPIDTAHAFIDHFYPGMRVIETMDDLLNYLNN